MCNICNKIPSKETIIGEYEKLIDFAMNSVGKFTVMDFAIFKLCLVSLGAILATCFTDFFKKYKVFVIIAFVASYVYLLYRLFADE